MSRRQCGDGPWESCPGSAPSFLGVLSKSFHQLLHLKPLEPLSAQVLGSVAIRGGVALGRSFAREGLVWGCLQSWPLVWPHWSAGRATPQARSWLRPVAVGVTCHVTPSSLLEFAKPAQEGREILL